MLVANNGTTDHARAITEILEDADQILIAVAFLKTGGADLLGAILEKRLGAGAEAEIFIGTDFFLTQPAALKRLLTLKDRYPACRVMVADQTSATFHPKAYVARKGAEYLSLIGSANLTAGGLHSNEELSLCVRHSAGDPLTAQLIASFERYREEARFQELDPLLLEQYASRYRIHEAERQKFERARDAALPAAFDLRVIDDWYARYLADAEAMSDLAKRKERRTEARRVQRAIAALNRGPIDRHARDAFREGLRDLMTSNGGRHLWFSGDIHRRGNEALDHPKEMIDLFDVAQRAARLPPREGYGVVREAGDPIPGVGLNMATEILCTFAPDRYAVYNGNTVGALGALGIGAPSYANFRAIGPARYENLCATIKALGARIGGADFSEADSFLNWIYWQTKNHS